MESFLTALFLRLLNMSLVASWVIFGVLLLRLVLKKAPRWLSLGLWLMVAVRLLLPFGVESRFSLIPSPEPLPQSFIHPWEAGPLTPEGVNPVPQVQSGIPAVDNAVNGSLAESLAPTPGASVDPVQVWMTLGSWVWLLGAAVLAGYGLFSYIHLHRRLRTAVRLEGRIYQSEFIPGPFLLGLLRPRIYLPYDLGKDALPYVLSHEKAHLRRLDNWWKALGYGILCLHWFNPLVWLCYSLLSRDIELACDETVIRELPRERRAAYAEALLACSQGKMHLRACPLAFGEGDIKTRLKAVMSYQKPRLYLTLGAVLLCILGAVLLLTNPVQKEEKKPPVLALRESAAYTLEEVRSGDFVLTEDLDLTSGGSLWNAFLMDTQKIPASVLLAQYASPGTGETMGTLFVKELSYDGSYHLRSIEQGQERTETYQYLHIFREPAPTEEYPDREHLLYVLTDRQHTTWEELWRSALSSAADVLIPFRIVCADYVWAAEETPAEPSLETGDGEYQVWALSREESREIYEALSRQYYHELYLPQIGK